MLPYEFERTEDDPDPPPTVDEEQSSRYSVGGASHPVEGSTDDVQRGQTIAKERVGIGESKVSEERGNRTGDDEVEG